MLERYWHGRATLTVLYVEMLQAHNPLDWQRIVQGRVCDTVTVVSSHADITACLCCANQPYHSLLSQ